MRNKMNKDDLSCHSEGLHVGIANHWLKLSSEAVWKFYCEKKKPIPSTSCFPGHPLTSNLLLQVEYNINSLLQYDQFGLWFFIAQMELTHVAQFLKSPVDVPHTEPLTGVVRHPPRFLPLSLDLHR